MCKRGKARSATTFRDGGNNNTNASSSTPNKSNSSSWVVPLLVAIGLVTSLLPFVVPSMDVHKTILAPLYGHYATTELEKLARDVPLLDMFHRLGGALYLVLGYVQFQNPPPLKTLSTTSRRHRWRGRLFFFLSMTEAISGMAFLVYSTPYSDSEVMPTILFGLWSMYCALRSWTEIAWRHDRVSHRHWAMRTFAVGLGVETIRVVYLVLTKTAAVLWRFALLSSSLSNADEDKKIFTAAFWLGWTMNVVVTELWILRQTQQQKGEKKRLQKMRKEVFTFGDVKARPSSQQVWGASISFHLTTSN